MSDLGWVALWWLGDMGFILRRGNSLVLGGFLVNRDVSRMINGRYWDRKSQVIGMKKYYLKIEYNK